MENRSTRVVLCCVVNRIEIENHFASNIYDVLPFLYVHVMSVHRRLLGSYFLIHNASLPIESVLGNSTVTITRRLAYRNWELFKDWKENETRKSIKKRIRLSGTYFSWATKNFSGERQSIEAVICFSSGSIPNENVMIQVFFSFSQFNFPLRLVHFEIRAREVLGFDKLLCPECVFVGCVRNSARRTTIFRSVYVL